MEIGHPPGERGGRGVHRECDRDELDLQDLHILAVPNNPLCHHVDLVVGALHGALDDAPLLLL